VRRKVACEKKEDYGQPSTSNLIRNDRTDLDEGGEPGMLFWSWKMMLSEDPIGFERDERGQG